MLCRCSQAKAHRREAEYRVLAGKKVQIESWFDLTGESPVGAKVTVYHANGAVVTQGQIDEKGLFVFPYARSEPLRVVVSAGAGHRKEMQVPAADLALADPRAAPSSLQADPRTPHAGSGSEPFADRSSKVSVNDVLLGLGLLLALAAFGLALGNARKLRDLRRQLHDKDVESRATPRS
jgi:hypothetical protein